MMNEYPDPNLDLLCIQQSDVAPFCKNFAFYFDAEKWLNRYSNG